MAKNTSIKKQLEESEFHLPVNPLTPEEKEYMGRKRKESIELAKNLLPDLKTRPKKGEN